jgi:hypothetical protein
MYLRGTTPRAPQRFRLTIPRLDTRRSFQAMRWFGLSEEYLDTSVYEECADPA